jgi:hypothetical protein
MRDETRLPADYEILRVALPGSEDSNNQNHYAVISTVGELVRPYKAGCELLDVAEELEEILQTDRFQPGQGICLEFCSVRFSDDLQPEQAILLLSKAGHTLVDIANSRCASATSSHPRLRTGRTIEQQENLELYSEALASLADRLVANGGRALLVPPDHSEVVSYDLSMLEEVGRFVDPRDATFEEGEPNGCHENARQLWAKGRGTLCTGYALSEDGLWRSHSWIEAADGRVIETTSPRTAYFGYAAAEAIEPEVVQAG